MNPFEALLKRLSALEGIHRLYEKAEDELVSHIRAPICVEKCGDCCKKNTPMVWGIEIEAIASFLLGQGELLDEVMDRCEEWLLDNQGPILSPQQLSRNLPQLFQRAHEVMVKQCPMLTEEMQCAIHTMRPLPCMAFGVTTYPVNCPRPLGLGETSNRKAYNEGMIPVTKKALNDLLVSSAEDDFCVTVGFLPTLLMTRLRSGAFTNAVDSGKVDPVKLVRNRIHSPSILSADQQFDFSLAGDEALREVEHNAIKTGPILVHAN